MRNEVYPPKAGRHIIVYIGQIHHLPLGEIKSPVADPHSPTFYLAPTRWCYIELDKGGGGGSRGRKGGGGGR